MRYLGTLRKHRFMQSQCCSLWTNRWRLEIERRFCVLEIARPHPESGAKAADHRPELWIVLDAALDGGCGKCEPGQRPTPPARMSDMIEKPDRAIRPLKLVALVAN